METPRIKFDLSPEDLATIAREATSRLRRDADAITASLTPEQVTFDNVIRPLAQIENEVDCDFAVLALLQNASPDENTRKAASTAIRVAIDAYMAVYDNEVLYTLVDAVRRKRDNLSLDFECNRLLERMHRAFVQEGAGLDPEKRSHLISVKKRLIDRRLTFMDNIASDPGQFVASETELKGLPAATIEGFERLSGDRRAIPLIKPNVRAILKNCERSAVRREVFLRDQSLFPQNVPILKELVIFRDEAARLLGYSSFAAQTQENFLVKTPAAVDRMLAELKGQVAPLVEQEQESLSKYVPQNGKRLYAWDLEYCKARYLVENGVDHGGLSEWFPAENTIRQMLGIFQNLFDLVIEPVDDLQNEEIWQSDVKVFRVWEGDKSAFLGHLYTDLYARPGKFTGAANFNIRPSFLDRSGQRVVAATSLICNLTPPTASRPSLLQHQELITVFHELGHAIHDLVGRSQFAKFHGHRAVKDFTEAPSQLLEYWCWEPSILSSMSCHYSYLSHEFEAKWRENLSDIYASKPSEKIPTSLLHDLVATKHVNEGHALARMIGHSLFDMEIYNPQSHEALEAMDLGVTANRKMQEATQLLGTENIEDMGNPQVTTAHFAWGVEACYYAYLQQDKGFRSGHVADLFQGGSHELGGNKTLPEHRVK